jgi:hypothetical protein
MSEAACSRCGNAMAEQHADFLVGVCDPCLKTLVSTRSDELSDLLESHHQPAALIAPDMTVLAFNSRFEQLFQSDHELGGMRVGEIVNCFHPTPEMPCGESHLCPHCEIRRLVELTRISGEKISKVPLSFRHKSGLDQTFVFTTHRQGETILLSIGA